MSSLKLLYRGIIFLSLLAAALALNIPHQPRIDGGEEVTNSDYTFFAFITATNASEASVDGSGFFITQRHVVTSGRFVIGFEKFTVRYGSSHFDQLSSTSDIESAEAHPKYGLNNYFMDDIAVITLTNAVDVGVANIPVDNSVAGIASMGTLIGFGDAPQTILRRTKLLLVIPNSDCGIYPNGNNIATETHFCAIDPIVISGPCASDYGAPLIDLEGVVVGIFSAAPLVCREGLAPVSYTRLSLHIDWLNVKINEGN